ncbi:MAG: hypothetical protein ACI8U3_002234 [Brevundimonas sp.]|jgi:hypothetical protein|uniref:hypothetical protein n=1 Tax=Brevundimonas sp. TaxID=1871086 RepID=UPI0039E4C38B
MVQDITPAKAIISPGFRMNLTIKGWSVISIWLALCALAAWYYTGHLGAAILTFFIVAIPLVLWIRAKTKTPQNRDRANK